ncbi:bacterial extracellular solute-binding protein, family 5, putative [Rhodospirillum centenum SW]|uniref:Bacterial extracellular solute-binding protein, family 5, putative n=2 Tax=Rhodospirillum centenum TaxID=34018 RepID=B6ISF0_RHOCS|nr:bacterial extracellular solute-binding protein, family 5, putative [Rhodospirillum centenum SW]
MISRPFLAAVAVILVALLPSSARPLMATVPTPDGEGGAPASRTLTIGVNDFPGNFNPLIESQGIRDYVVWMAQRPLTAFTPDWELTCVLCTELPTVRNGRIQEERLPDGDTGVAVRYTLLPDLRWGDGTPVTTRDVVFTWQVGRHPDIGSNAYDVFARDIRSVEVVDDRTFIVHRRHRSCAAAQLNEMVLLPAHLERKAFESDPATYRINSRYEADVTDPGLWLGPYRLAAVETGKTIQLERNPHWNGRQPYFDRIVVRTLDRSAELERALLAGEVDYVSGEHGFSVHQSSQFERHYGFRFAVFWMQGLGYRHLDVNHDNPILADVRVRRALLLGLDRDTMNERLYYGRNVIADTDTNPLDGIRDPDVRRHAYDPAGAMRLLEEAGWRPGPDGIRVDAAGHPLEVDLWAGKGDRTVDLELQIIQENWRRIGVRMVPRQTVARVLFGEILPQRRFSGLALFSWITAPREIPRSVLHSSQIPSAENGWSGLNYGGYRNPGLDRVLDDLERVCEPEANRALWSRLQHLYADDLPALPIFHMANAYFFPPWLKGVVPTGHQFASSMAVENWYREDVP